mmetsp:Transcript_8610/g.21159  ORF Transcript_8610/g.21159 Transcript_8610/m.21159 type:complete len:237 (-) Transcript_8610:2177-2887(-)
MRSFFLLIAGLLLAGNVSASTETTATIEAQTIDNKPSFQELRFDRDVQSRRKEWDIFGVLLMMVHHDCGPGGRVGLLECHLLEMCDGGFMGACDELCAKADHPGPHDYSVFCGMSSSSSSQSDAVAGYSADEYNGNSTPGSFVGSGSYSAAFNGWMVAVVISVAMALVAVHIGQRREEIEQEMARGVNVRGSVGRRAQVVSGLMDGVLGDANPKQVELSEYRLEPARTSSYESAIV